MHSFLIKRDDQGRAVICSREFDEFEEYSAAHPIFKDDGFRPEVTSVPGVELRHNEAHPDVMAKVRKLLSILENFRQEDLDANAAGTDGLRQPRLMDLQNKLPAVRAYFDEYDKRMTKLKEDLDANVPRRAAFQLGSLPRHNGGN